MIRPTKTHSSLLGFSARPLATFALRKLLARGLAAIWAMAYGHREFVVIIGASEGAALEMLDSIKTELEVNEHLA